MSSSRRLKAILYNGLRLTGINAALRRRRAGPLVLCYHNVVGEQALGVGEPSLHLSIDQFADQISWLIANYELISLDRVIEAHRQGDVLRGGVAITFDDAYRGVFDHALPLLARQGIPATIFVVGTAPSQNACFWWDHPAVVSRATPALQEHWLHALQGDAHAIYQNLQITNTAEVPDTYHPASWTAIEAAVRRHGNLTIGAHTMSHHNMAHLPVDQVAEDAQAVRHIISERLGTAPSHYAYPYGRWSEVARNAVIRAGYSAAFTLDEGFCHPRVDAGALPRLNIPAGMSQPAFEAWVSFGGQVTAWATKRVRARPKAEESRTH